MRKTSDSVRGGYHIKHDESTQRLKGEYHIVLRDAATGRIIDERKNHNLIVNAASILIARLLKDSKEPSAGISYLAVGTGGPSWNLQNPPQPTNVQTELFNEIARKAFTTPDVYFVDPTTGNPTVTPTNVVDYTVTFAETEAVGALVEMSLFGGDAGDYPGSGDSMINYRTFPVINKTNSMTLTITFRITA
jgi:hypothetical protein